MPFVAKAIGPTGHAKWLTTPKLDGMRTFGTREMAEVFWTQRDAEVAIGEVALHQPCDGLTFSTEPAHPTGPNGPHFSAE
jgi:hypothetical protein